MKKDKIGRMYLVGMWKEHKGLMALLVVGGVILVLAAMVSGAWAAPNQSPLRQTIPDPNSIDGTLCNNNDGVPGCQIGILRSREGVALAAVGDTPIPNVTVTLSNGSTQTTTSNANGYFKFTGLPAGSTWVVTALGFSRTVTIGASNEGVIQDFWFGMDPVGGYALPVNRFELLAPWIGLAALMGVVGAAVVVRRRRQR